MKIIFEKWGTNRKKKFGFKEECLEYKESSKFKYSFNSVWMSDREKWEEIISKNDAFAS